MSGTIKSIVGKISQETIMILAIGVTMLVSTFAAWNSLAGQIDELRRAMHEGDARLRQERREDVAGLRGEMADLRTELRGEMADLRTELRGEMAELRTEVRAMGQRIDRLTETVMLVVAEVRRDTRAPGGSGAPEDLKPERENP